MRKVFSYRKDLGKPIGCKRCRKRITLRRRGRKGTAERKARNVRREIQCFNCLPGNFAQSSTDLAQVFD